MEKKFINSILFFIISCSMFAANLTRDNYYVKVDGTGDGSSWENAMSAEVFATALSTKSTLKSGVTFHLAAGTYHPMYDPYPEEHEGYSNEELFKAFYVHTPINIIGGYSPNPTDGEVANPSNYSSVISGDMMDDNIDNDWNTNRTDDLYNLFVIDLKEKAQCSFSGITFTCTQGRRAGDDGAFKMGGLDGYYGKIGAILNLNRCTFKFLTGTFSTASIDYDEVIVRNCTFNESPGNIYNLNKGFVESCTFENCNSMLSANELTIQNCTFYETPISLSVHDEVIFHNNTVVLLNSVSTTMDISDLERIQSNVSMIGNIFDCEVICRSDNDPRNFVSRYNIYRNISEDMSARISFDDDYVTTSLEEILEKDWEDKPQLAYNGGYTKTIKVISDKLSKNNRSIHFDRSETTVTTDQRGVARFAKTCMGAYEKRDTSICEGYDTITVGEKFLEKTFDKIGVYKVPEVLTNVDGYDSVSIHTLYVIPSKDRHVFYVKTNGTGDGSSWDKAMSPEDFAWQMALSQTTDTFHVAAGTYYPIPTTTSTKHYERESPFCLIGGYPSNITDENQKPDPINNETIFSVDFKGDNTYDPTGHRVITGDDDVQNIFDYSPLKDGACLVYGIVFEGGREGTYGNMEQFRIANLTYSDINFTFEKCKFREGYTSLFNYSAYVSVLFKDCYFYHIAGPLSFGGLDMSSCTFNDCRVAITSYKSVNVSNCTMFNLYGFSFNILENKELKFYNNTVYSPSNKGTIVIDNSIAGDLYLKGNIIQGTFQYNEEKTSLIHSSYNLFSQDALDFKSATDRFTDDFSFLYDNKIVKEDGVFTPLLVLKEDELENGSSLRFSRFVTDVITDQKGDYRSSMTCMGSYEIVKLDTVLNYNKDTIYVGGQFEGVTYEKMGIYDSIPILLQGTTGRDSIVELHTLCVLSKNKQTTFYVKVDGKGDGTSWEDAMSPEDFALRFRLTETTDTFHLAEGTYYPIEIQRSRIYDRTYPFTLIGGYRKDISDEQEKPNPTLYKTVLSVDFNGDNKFDETSNNLINDNEDSFYVILYTSKSNDEVFVSGIVFEGGRRSYGGDSYIGQFTIKDGNKFTFEKCEFRNNYNMAVNSTFGGRSVIFNNCYFYQVRVDAVNVLKYNSCTFENIHNSFYFSAFKKGSTSVSNCSILNCIPCNLSLSSSEKIDFVNNTLSMPRGENAIKIRNYDEDIEVNMIGNIIQGSITKTESEKSLDIVKSSYNVYSEESEINSATDIIVEDFSSFLASDTTHEKGVFTPLLVLNRDVLSDGTELRFPRSETSVKEDQRGMVRPAMTNMGSYELFKTDTLPYLKNDTILVGGQFEGLTYEKIGVYDSIMIVLQDMTGRDSLVEYHKLWVLPKGNQTTFYVKTNGKGDGSSWEDAMSPEDFALQMELSQSTDTFHVAAGTYYPTATTLGTKHYERKAPFCLIGGYPSNITDENQKPDPINNETIFSVDFKGDNEYDPSEHRVITGDDDEQNIFAYFPLKDGACFVSGIVFEGGREGTYGNMEQFRIQNVTESEFNFTFENCTFRKGGHSSVVSYCASASLFFKNCYFYHISVTRSFCNYDMSSCTFKECTIAINTRTEKTVNVSNCTMFDLYGFNLYPSENSQLNFYNNTIYSPSNEVTIVIDNSIAGDLNLKGNIIQGTIKYNEEKTNLIHSSYNLFSQDALAFKSETDLVTDDFSFLYDNKTVKEDGVFTPVLVLKNDVTSDGSSLRFLNDSDPKVEFDQRGVSRSSRTCMGSYELPKMDTIFFEKNDTIKVGETFIVDDYVGEKYNKIGIYDSVAVVYPDKVVLHTLYVIPTGEQTTFYVKTNGKGDGSSWDEAMSPEDFAWQMELSQTTDTFHVAAGTYYPIVTTGTEKFYKRNTPFRLIGGYPSNITDETQEPDPINNETILSVDFNGNNNFNDDKFDLENTDDDAFYVLVMEFDNHNDADVYISGIVFEGGKSGPLGKTNNCGLTDLCAHEMVFDKCTFRKGYRNVIGGGESLVFNNCYFNQFGVPRFYVGNYVQYNSCTFEKIYYSLAFDSQDELLITNCTMFQCVPVVLNNKTDFINNTVCSPRNDVAVTLHAANLKGNIIQGAVQYNEETVSQIHSSYNIFSQDTFAFKSETDLVTDDFTFLFDNKTVKEDDVFTPLLALKSDTLSDGTSLRYPNDEPKVEFDQRGVTRTDMTCRGSYEAVCRNVEKHLNEIEYYSMDNQSEKNYNFETVGLHEYVETLESRCGADSVVYHKIYIAPSLQNTDYYVKGNASGTGDGSSWKDAMNDTSFVYAFANAPSGATFHIAAGTYHPLMNYTIIDNVGEFHNDFYRTKAVNVIGGYRAEITDEKEEANPILYKTVLIADINGDGKDENKRIISINLEEESANCLFSGLAFEGGITSRMNLHGQLDLTSNHNDLNVTVEKCEFRNAVHGIFSIDSCTANINNCYFPNGHGFSLQTGDIKVNSCTFEGDNAIDFKVTPNSRLTIANSTIYNVDNFYLIPFSLSEIQFYNNTIYSENGIVNINPSENSKLILRGNLIKGELLYDQEYANTIQSKYNAYSNQESAIVFKSNQDILTDDFESFLDTKTTTEEDIFTPVLVLKSDVTSDGSSLRFPNDSVPEVNEDQRGVHRSLHTCMGSYELPKMDTIIRYNTDTIKVGETFIVDGFVGEKYDKIGIYDSVAVVYADSVVLHTVCVIPTGEQTTFYVKTNGKGDGSSWDEAMSPEDFAWQMALSQTTDTFHVAAGIYHPIKTTGASNYYTRSTSFRLIGGYPRNITDETQEPDPINNETILSADFNENNNFNDDNFDLENTDEDADNVLNLNFYNRTDADVYISGIVFEGGKSAPLGKSNNCGILKSCAHEIVFDKCAFRKGYRNVIGGGESLIFNNCYFYQYGVPLFNFGNYVQFNSCTFEKIYSKFFIYSNDELSFTNCTMFQCVPISNNLAYSNKIDFINNTVYSPSKEIAINFGNVVDFNLKGNIIQGAVQYNEETVSQIHSSYNIFSQDTFAFISATDLVTDDFTFLFDNKTVKEDDVFTPLLALKSDTLSDGTSLRFPNDEPKVEFDQRGVTRTDMTCRGSYEAVCRNVEKHLPGIEYYSMDNQSEHGYNIGSLGMHEIVEVKESFCGADSIVYHNVYIAPSLNKKEYYVKVDGKGDGSSWDNAMSDTSFAYVFANATQKGVTFYVAEGTYRPLMDFGGMYKRSNSVNVIGGYRADITDENEAANPIANKTILSGDLNNNGKADTDRIISIEADEASSCTFRGLVFDKCNMEGRYGYAGEIHLVSNKNDLNITVERCKFQDGYHGIFAFDTCTATINNCHFVDGLDFSFQQGDINVNSCTFESGNIYIISANNSKVTMTNNAIYKIKKLNLITNAASELRLINNTVYSSTTDTISLRQYDNGGELYLYGNLFKGKLLVDKNYDYNKLHSAYNGYSASKDSIKFDSHEDLFKVDFSSLFINNGITTVDTLYVPILVLKQDSLPVDTSFISLRFPRNYDSMTQEVTYDQRGVKRPDMTCMGAYEAKCQSVEIYLTKTEYISKDNLSKYGMSFDTMGIHTYIDTLTCSCGADSLIYHTVYVVPSLKQKEYYVKVNGEGNGDGSSWENAMNDTSFAYLLTNAQSGATFYMAEGTYAPIFSMDGSSSSDKIFYTEKSFNIEGGYSKKSSNTSANKNPRKYVTEFVKSKDADINGVVLKINNSKKNEQSSIYGVTFQGKYRAQKGCTDTMLYVSGEDAFSFKIEKCSFNESYYGVLSENIKLDVTGSEFKENRHSFVVRNDKTNDTVQVTATLFERNDFSVDASLNGVFVLLNSTFYKNDTFQLKPQASCLIYNNTVLYDLMNIQIKNKKYPLTLVGNIIMNMDTVGSIQNCQINTKSNLFQENSSFKTDRDFEVEDFKNILKCDEFSNYLLDEESNTVEMICDTLLNGQLLRYRRESLVLTDQRGVERNEMCCIGAYEMPFKSEPCETIVTEIEDTIHVGETYLNQLYDQVGRYVLDADTLTSLQGCDSIVIIRLEVLPEVVKPIPTAFTPYEKNGKNDIFMPGYEVYIYDVYGMVLTHSTNGWDGTVNDELVRPGIYVYAVLFDPNTIKKGTVEVLQEP